MDAHIIIERHEHTIHELCEEIERLQETVKEQQRKVAFQTAVITEHEAEIVWLTKP